VAVEEGLDLTDVFDLGLTREELTARQKTDKETSEVYRRVEQGAPQPQWEEVATWSENAKALWWQWPRLALRDGVLVRRWESLKGDVVSWQIIVPKEYRQSLITRIHSGMTGGHMGRDKTLAQVSRRAYWPTWRSDVIKNLNACSPCAQYHRGGPPKQVKLKPLVTGNPGERLGVDITGPHPRSRNGFRYMLTVIDHFTKWAEAYPLREHTAPTVAKTLVAQWISRFGCPKQILSDQGPEFTSQLLVELCKNLRVDKVRTSAYKASTNGAVERLHKTINEMLGKVVAEQQKDWDLWVPIVMAAYRASPHSATKVSPNRLVLGRETVMPIDIVLGRPEQERNAAETYEEFAEDLAARLERAFELVREHLGTAAERRKATYDLRVRSKSFATGQWVWCYNPRKYRGRTPKWQRLYTGPYLVVREIPPANYVIQRTKQGPSKVVHGDKLKAWEGDPLPSWLETSAEGSAKEQSPVEPSAEEEVREGQTSAEPEKQAETEKPRRKRDGKATMPNIPEENEADADEALPVLDRPKRNKRLPPRLAGYQL
jgi:transposase InsO family protein